MKLKRGLCSLCTDGKEKPIINVKFFLCNYHNNLRLQKDRTKKVYTFKKSPLKRTAIKKKFRKATGEREMFLRIAAARPHLCQVCGGAIPELKVHNFAHILSKGSHPSLRLNEENILIMCWSNTEKSCHDSWDNKSKSALMQIPQWKPIFELAEKLKSNYHDR